MALFEYLIEARKIAMKTGCGDSVCTSSVLGCLEQTKMKFCAIDMDHGPEIAIGVSVDTLESSRVVFLPSLVSKIFGMGRFSQIIPSIIGVVGGFVVNLMFGPSSCHDDKGQPVSKVHFTGYTDKDVSWSTTASTNASGRFTGFSSGRSIDLPCQNTGAGIVVEDRSDKTDIKIVHISPHATRGV